MKTFCWLTMALFLLLAGCAAETSRTNPLEEINYSVLNTEITPDAACSPGCAPGQPSSW